MTFDIGTILERKYWFGYGSHSEGKSDQGARDPISKRNMVKEHGYHPPKIRVGDEEEEYNSIHLLPTYGSLIFLWSGIPILPPHPNNCYRSRTRRLRHR